MSVFCSDIDGTLLNADRTLSPRTIAAIRAVRDAGHAFVLCSSRMPESLRILQALYDGLGGPLIAYNGGLVLSSTGEAVHDVAIGTEDASAIFDMCVALDVHGSFFAGDDWYAWADDGWTAREVRNTGVDPRPERAADYVSRGGLRTTPPHKIMCMGEPSSIDQIEASLKSHPAVVAYRQKNTYLEVANAACSKGAGVAAILAHLGVAASDCYFFGDNYNDISAFEVAGTSIAVANAIEPVLKIASVVTARNDEDGVARYLESWLAAQH